MTANESSSSLIKSEGNVNLVLNRYDRQRVPIPVLLKSNNSPSHSNSNSASSGIVLEKFRNELSCKVCQKLLIDPVLSRTCMHRFCSGCVVDGADITLTRCPECDGQFLKDSPFLRDHNFCQIIKKLKSKECDTGRRNLYAALQATGVDVNGCLNKSQLERHIYRNQWTCDDESAPGPSDSLCPDTPPLLLDLNNSSSSFSETSSNSLKFSLVEPELNDVIHLITANGGIQLFYHQLLKLPFILEPNSLLHLSESSRSSNSLQAFSLCGGIIRPSFVAKLQDIRFPFNSTKEIKQLFSLLPAFILKLFPKDFMSKFLQEREFVPDMPLLSYRQKINNGMLVGVILFPDSSVTKMKDIPNCMRRPRYIYSPPNATVGHLQEFLIVRSEIESKFRARIKFEVEFAAILGERQEIILRLNTNPDEQQQHQQVPRNDGGRQQQQQTTQEFVLRVRCPPSKYSDKRLSRFDNMIVLRYPFQPLPKNLKIKDLIDRNSISKRPLKVVFRYSSINK